MGRPGEFTPSEIKLLRWLRAHGPAGIGQTAAAVGEPTTNFGRRRLGEVETQLSRLREVTPVADDAIALTWKETGKKQRHDLDRPC